MESNESYRNFEETVALAIIEVLSQCGDADIQAGIGYMFQEPLDDDAKTLLDKIGVAAIKSVAEWNMRYATREKITHD